MAEPSKDLGKLVAIYGIAPAYLQRAVFIIILSFAFFLAMMFIFYIRQSMIYFLLASAFLVLYLVMMFSFVMQRRTVVEIYEGGLKLKKRSASWNEIAKVSNDGSIRLHAGKEIALPRSLNDFEALVKRIQGTVGVKL